MKKIFKLTIFFTVILLSIEVYGIIVVSDYIKDYQNEVIQNNPIEDYEFKPNKPSYIYAEDGTLLAELYKEKRQYKYSYEIPEKIKEILIAVEDRRYYEHHGVDPQGILRAVYRNYLAGDMGKEGASTLTQQLTRQLFLTTDKTIERKLKEIVLGVKLEGLYDKSSILEMYLNQMYFGHQAYGISTASSTYFNKDIEKLNIEEVGMLVGLLQAPSKYDLIKYEDKANERKKQILFALKNNNIITSEEFNKFQKHKISAVKKEEVTDSITNYKYPYFTTWAIQELEKQYGEELYTGGLHITTTLDTKAQDFAIETAKKQSENFSNWYKMNDIAITTINPQTGALKAMVGGANFEVNQVNMATTPRQPGSSMKPFVYGAGFEYDKISGSTIILDEPVTYGSYKPHNFSYNNYGYITARKALYTSNNIVAIKTGIMVGHQNIKNFIEKLGVTSLDPTDANISMSVGGLKHGISPYEMASAYGVFANKGVRATPHFVKKIEDEYGNTIKETKIETEQVIKESTTNEITDILIDVVQKSTGRNAAIGRSLAGKTGTTNGSRDWWFVGYTPNAATAVWVGNSDFKKAVGSGYSSTTAARAFGDYMNKYKTLIPNKNFGIDYALVYKNFYLSKDEVSLVSSSCSTPFIYQGFSDHQAEYVIKKLAVYPSYKPAYKDCPDVEIGNSQLKEFLQKDLNSNLAKVMNSNNKELIIESINLGYGTKLVELGYLEKLENLDLKDNLINNGVLEQEDEINDDNKIKDNTEQEDFELIDKELDNEPDNEISEDNENIETETVDNSENSQDEIVEYNQNKEDEIIEEDDTENVNNNTDNEVSETNQNNSVDDNKNETESNSNTTDKETVEHQETLNSDDIEDEVNNISNE